MISLYDVLKVANGQLFGEPAAQLFTEFCLHAQEAHESVMFVARRTDAGDTHRQIETAIRNGASGILCTEPPVCDTDGVTVLMVPDTRKAMMDWAHLILGRMGTKVIGITGSTGKSVTAAVLKRILSLNYQVLDASQQSHKGPLSIPLALSQLNSQHDFVVLKLGITHPGEMAEMIETVQPNIGIVTHVDYAHSDSFANREELALEMALLVEYLSPANLAILNYDDDFVRSMSSNVRSMVRTAGIDSFSSDLMAYNLILGPTGTGFDLRSSGERYVGRWIPLLGKQSLYSVLFGLLVGQRYAISIEEALKTLTDMAPLPGRMNPLAGKHDSLLVDDTYLANPLSTLEALGWLRDARVEGQRVIFVMGDMDQLGSYSQYNHRKVGQQAAQVADVLVTQGTEAAYGGRAAIDEGMNPRNVHITYSTQDTVAILERLDLNENDVILVKGGQSASMESVVQALLQNETDREMLVRQGRAPDTSMFYRSTRPSWVEIDTDALATNVHETKKLAGEDVSVMAVVKANGYGHGAVTAARTALLNGASYLAVASIAEALELRDAGIDAPILILSYAPIFTVRQALQQNLTFSVYDLDMARAYNRAASELDGQLQVHVKIDTGMGRLGIMESDTASAFRQLGNLENLDIEGIYTHFAAADNDGDYTAEQIERFKDVVRTLGAAGFKFTYTHAANSGGVLRAGDAGFNMVRTGLILYGLSPSSELTLPEAFKPVMSWKTVVAQVRTFPPGYPIGYGNTYRTRSSETIAILPVGYADGLRRSPNTWHAVLIKGQRAPLVGRVSMEKIAVNVSHIPDVTIGDEVVLLGQQGDDMITADEIAGWLGTINYEVVTTILPRVPRH